MQINEEELVDDIKRFVSENVSLSKISDEELAERIDQIVTDRLKDIYCPIETKVSISQQVYSSIRGFGLLDSIISDDSITEVMINGPEKIFIEKKGRLTRLDKKFESQRKLEDVIQRIVGLAGREVNQAKVDKSVIADDMKKLQDNIESTKQKINTVKEAEKE